MDDDVMMSRVGACTMRWQLMWRLRASKLSPSVFADHRIRTDAGCRLSLGPGRDAIGGMGLGAPNDTRRPGGAAASVAANGTVRSR